MTYDQWYALFESRGLNHRRCGCFATEAVRRGCVSTADLIGLDDAELLLIPNIGRKSVRLLREAFDEA